MPKAEAGTPKAIANAMKAKGLGRLRWFCQVCQKQCRDDNGFKMHSQSETHLRQMLLIGENAGKHIDQFSQDFLSSFLNHLSRRHSTTRVRANAVYNEYIQDKTHLHMNATKWVTLTEFVIYLGKEGLVRVDENEKGLWIEWVDRSAKAMARQAELQKKERADLDDEQRQARHLASQIARAKAQAAALAEAQGGSSGGPVGLQMKEGEKLSLSFGLGGKKEDTEREEAAVDGNAVAGPGPSSSAAAAGLTEKDGEADGAKTEEGTNAAKPPQTGFSFSATMKKPQPSLNVFKQKSNALKRSRTDDDEAEQQAKKAKETANLAGKKFLTAAEKLMLEDQERMKRGGGRGLGYQGMGGGGGGYQGMGPQRGGARKY